MALKQMLMRGLPLELLLSVVSYVDETADLASLCVTSKLFFSIAQASLYKTISVGGGNLQGLQYGMKKLALDDHFNLYRTLQSTNNIYTFVTDFRVHFQPCSRGKERLGVPCRCDDFDTMLGQALIRLENIRTLGFRCICCKSRDWKASRHQYLNELQCKQLDQLIFRCSCYAFDARYKNTSIFFDKPFMSTVQSLSLSSVPLGVASVLARDGCLPALKKLSCNDQNSVEKLLAKGILTHLMAEFIFDRDLASILSQIPPSLQHLVIGDVLDQLNLYGALNSHSYPNIRHLGIFSLNTLQQDEFTGMREVLSCFPNLHSIEIQVLEGWGRDDEDKFIKLFSDTGFFREIDQPRVAPALKKVYIDVTYGVGKTGHCHWICVLHDSKWQLQQANRFTSWEIMLSSGDDV